MAVVIATYNTTATTLDALAPLYVLRFARWHALGLRFVDRRECPRVVRYPARGGAHALIRS